MNAAVSNRRSDPEEETARPTEATTSLGEGPNSLNHALRILVADDDVNARLAVGRLLEAEGFVVDVAEDGACALDAARHTRPDVVLTDLQMPGMDGVELCRRLHELDPTLPVLVMTAFGSIPTAVAAVREGASDYLSKPLDFDAALLAIHRVLEFRALRIERDQLRLHEQALREEALAAVRAHEEILSVVSHDLRAPLQIIDWHARLLATATEGRLSPKRMVDIGERLCRASTQMNRLVTDLLDESHVRAGHLTIERTLTLVSELLADIAELRPLAWQNRVVLRVEPLAEDRGLLADRLRLGQVFSNLVTNAIKFSPPRGNVVVSAETTASGVCFSVRDEGPGISKELLPRIFERFFSGTVRDRAGAGLGLYIARSIVEAHGGRIWVESEQARGATFQVLLPAADRESIEMSS